MYINVKYYGMPKLEKICVWYPDQQPTPPSSFSLIYKYIHIHAYLICFILVSLLAKVKLYLFVMVLH